MATAVDQLTAFVRDCLARGAARGDITRELAAAGWSEREESPAGHAGRPLPPPPAWRGWLGCGLAAALACLVTALALLESPLRARQLRLDAEQVGDMETITRAIEDYYERRGELPGSLDDLGADRADDRAASVGMWDVQSVEVNGKQIDPELMALLQVAYRADGSWSVLFKGLQLAEGTSTNDQAAHPKTFEMETLASEHSTPQKYTGIYRLEDDTRQLCFVEAGLPRPDTFAAPRGSRRVLVTLRRANAMFAPRGAGKTALLPLRRRHATAAWAAGMIWELPQRTIRAANFPRSLTR